MVKKIKSAQRKKIIKNLAWDYFSLFIRIRDGWKCVVCKKTYNDGFIMQAGHIVERRKHITLFNEDNVHCQCSGCNGLHRYSPHVYYNWFITNYGQEAFIKLTDPATLSQIYKIDYDAVMETYRHKILGLCFTNNLKDYEQEKLNKLEKQYNRVFA